MIFIFIRPPFLWFLIMRRIAQNTYVLFKFLNFCSKYSNFISLKLIIFNNFFQIFIQNLIFIPLLFNIGFKLLIIFPSFNVKLILNDFSFFDENVHHDVNFLSNLISIFFEKLEDVVALNKRIFKLFYLLVHRTWNVVNLATHWEHLWVGNAQYLRIVSTCSRACLQLTLEIGLTWECTLTQNSYSWTIFVIY